VDPVTLVVAAVALGASAGLTETASSAVKDAYAGLKRLLNHRQIDVSSVERNPDSTKQQEALRETLATAPDVVDQDLLDAAEQVTDVIATDQPDIAGVVGVDLEDVRTGFIRVRSISSSGPGFRGARLTVDGGIDIGDVQAGRLRGDTDPLER
jgi:hypothetical protein